MKSRFIVLCSLFIMLAAMVTGVSAQTDVNCLGLNSDDCAIISQATANTANIQSFTQNFTFEFTVSGMAAMSGGSGPDSMSIKADGSGPFTFNPAATDPTAMFNMAMDINGSVTGTGEDQSGSVSFVIVDGVIYAKDESGAWKGAPLAEIAESFTQQMGALTGGGMGGGDSSDPTAMLNNPAVAGLMGSAMNFDPVNIPGFISQERQADAELNGQRMIAFNYTADIGTLLQSAEFQKLLSDASAAAAQADPEAAQMAMMAPMFANMVSGNFNYTRWVGADDGFVNRIAIVGDLNLDLSMMMGSSGGGAAMPPINLKLIMVIDLSSINNTAAPVAPEGATIGTMDDLMG